jgi:hypothetical protein
MATNLRVGPVHTADTASAATELAHTWVAEHRPHFGTAQYPYDVTVALLPAGTPYGFRYDATVHATWTPDPTNSRPTRVANR